MKVFVVDDDPVYKLIVQRMFSEIGNGLFDKFFQRWKRSDGRVGRRGRWRFPGYYNA